MKRLFLALIVALLPATGWGQATVLQGGSWTSGLLPVYSSTGGGSQPFVQNSGPASGSGVGIKELSVIARGTGTAPYAAQGSGQLGTVFQIQDAPSSNSTGYHALSFSANAQGGGLIAYNAYGGASALPLYLNLNGTTYQFPFSAGGIVGPATTVIGDLACWANTVGTLLSDCGTLPSGGGGGTGMQVATASGAVTAATGLSMTVVVNKSVPATTSVVLPAASNFAGCPSTTENKCPVYRVKDGGGNSGTYAITISTADGKTIDGQSTYILNSNWSSIGLTYNGTQWNLF